MKFKVGDKVKILNGSKITNYNSGWLSDMNDYVGNITTIKKIGSCMGYRMEECGFTWDERGLELVDYNKITINRYNNKVVAKLGKKVGVARCCPDDEFDFYTGSKLALDRLFGKEEKETKPKELLNGKFICVRSNDTGLTVGKIYEFKDGFSCWDSGNRLPNPRFIKEPIKNLEDLNGYIAGNFIQLVEK